MIVTGDRFASRVGYIVFLFLTTYSMMKLYIISIVILMKWFLSFKTVKYLFPITAAGGPVSSYDIVL